MLHHRIPALLAVLGAALILFGCVGLAAAAPIHESPLQIRVLDEDATAADLVTDDATAQELGGPWSPIGAPVATEPDASCDGLLPVSASDGAEDAWLACIDALDGPDA